MISKINTIFRVLAIILLILPMLSSCGALQYRPVSAKDYPPEPEKRIKKNMEEGRGIRLFKGRKIIIFDEVTSALDLKNENQILKEIKKFKKNKIIFIISHKKSSLKICDQIYEIKDLKLRKVL